MVIKMKLITRIELTRYRIYRSKLRKAFPDRQLKRRKTLLHYKKRRLRRTKRFSWDTDRFYFQKRLKKATTLHQFSEYFASIGRQRFSSRIRPVFGYSKINDIFFHRRRAVREMNKLVTMVHILVGKPKMKYDPILLSDRAYVKLLRSSSTNRLNKKNRLEYSKESNKQIGERHWIFFGRDRIIGYMPRPILNRAIRIRRAKRNISNWRIQTQHVPYERVRAEEIARVKHMHYWQYAKNMRFRTRTEFRGNRTRVPPGELGLGFLALFENTVLPLIEYMPPVLITVFLMLLFYKLCYIVVYLSILIKGYAFNLFVDNTKDIATPINFGFTSRNLQHAMLQNAHNTLFLRTTPNFQPYLFQSRHVALMHNSQAFYPTPHWFVFTFPLKYVNFKLYATNQNSF